MNYKELSNFTHKELHHFHHAQLEKDKFVLIDYFSKHENEIPEAIINKLYELCNQTVKAYTEASNEKISFIYLYNINRAVCSYSRSVQYLYALCSIVHF